MPLLCEDRNKKKKRNRGGGGKWCQRMREKLGGKEKEKCAHK